MADGTATTGGSDPTTPPWRGRSPVRATLVAIAVLLSLAACSDDDGAADDDPEAPVTVDPTAPDDAGDATTAPGSAADDEALASYLQAGNTVCEEMVRGQQELLAAYDPPGPQGLEQMAEALSTQARLIEKTLVDLRQLTPPADQATTIEDLHSQVDSVVTLADEAAAAAAAGEQAEFDRLLGELGVQIDEANASYRAFGLDTCAE